MQDTPTIVHAGAARECSGCDAYYVAVAGRYHPDSDVGPWDDACPECGHIGGHPDGCSIAELTRAVLDAERALGRPIDRDLRRRFTVPPEEGPALPLPRDS